MSACVPNTCSTPYIDTVDMMQELVCGESARGVISRVSKSTSVPHQRTIPPLYLWTPQSLAPTNVNLL